MKMFVPMIWSSASGWKTMFMSSGVMRRTISGRMRMARVWVSAAAAGTAIGGMDSPI
jgi:hypothetical protein